MSFWLMKTEPSAFSIDDLETLGVEHWDGIRNYQVRNFIRDDMKIGDMVLIYHSSCKKIGVAGVAEIVKEAYPDHTQFDPKSKYFDAKSKEDNPRWLMVDLKFHYKYKDIISMDELRKHPELADMRLLQKGNRLSITPVEKNHFDYIDSLGTKA